MAKRNNFSKNYKQFGYALSKLFSSPDLGHTTQNGLKLCVEKYLEGRERSMF
jgi:hypothetical protein